MPVYPYINFSGTCRDEVVFYAAVFQTQAPRFLTFGAIPQNPDFPLSEGAKELVMYTELSLAGGKIQFSDVPPWMPEQPGGNVHITVESEDKEQLKTWFDGLKQNGTVGMELDETAWSPLYGIVTDQFGVTWQLNCKNTA